MLEAAEQRILVRWMKARGLMFFSVPNEAAIDGTATNKLKLMGLSPGAPDIVIVTRPASPINSRIVAVELKKAKGGVVSKEQESWHDEAAKHGWLVVVCHGAKDAIKKLSLLYGLKP